MIAISAIAGIISELLKLYNMLMGRYNDPAVVQSKLNQIHEDLKNKVTSAEAVLANPNSTDKEKDAALQAIRLADS